MINYLPRGQHHGPAPQHGCAALSRGQHWLLLRDLAPVAPAHRPQLGPHRVHFLPEDRTRCERGGPVEPGLQPGDQPRDGGGRGRVQVPGQHRPPPADQGHPPGEESVKWAITALREREIEMSQHVSAIKM